jgi:hypothetical protein
MCIGFKIKTRRWLEIRRGHRAEPKQNETETDDYLQNVGFGSKPSHNTNGRLCMAKSVSPSRFYSLDALRGVAALSVVRRSPCLNFFMISMTKAAMKG